MCMIADRAKPGNYMCSIFRRRARGIPPFGNSVVEREKQHKIRHVVNHAFHTGNLIIDSTSHLSRHPFILREQASRLRHFTLTSPIRWLPPCSSNHLPTTLCTVPDFVLFGRGVAGARRRPHHKTPVAERVRAVGSPFGPLADALQRQAVPTVPSGQARRLLTTRRRAARLLKLRSGGSRSTRRRSRPIQSSNVVSVEADAVTRRHRNRKAEYISSLEAELARLRHADAEVNSEKDALEQQNQAMRDLLASQSINAQLDSISLSSQAPSVGSFGGMVNMHFDEQAASDRWFVEYLDSESMQWTSSDTSGSEGLDASPQTPINGDSWAALDFILALEHPCRDHVHHPMINPEAWLPEPGSGHGHAMTTTAAVFAGALPFEGVVNKANQYVLPHTEIDKSVHILPSCDEELTFGLTSTGWWS